MDKKNFIACNEGYEKKGGIGKKPNVPRPNPPKGQGTPNKSNRKTH